MEIPAASQGINSRVSLSCAYSLGVKMNILLSAFACDPYFGSDEEVGWRWALGLARLGHSVSVITRASHQQEIEKYRRESGLVGDITFHYVDIPALHRVLSKVNRRNHIYYYFWQIAAYRKAKALHKQHSYDLVHHVTWVSFRQPSFMGLLGIPLIFGPVAGGDEIPRGYIDDFSLRQKVVEYVRWFANVLVRFDPLMLLTFKTARRVIFTSESHYARVPQWVRNKASVELAIGCDDSEATAIDGTIQLKKTGKRLLFAGRCIGWKGMDIGLRIFAKVLARDPEIRLTIIGDGVDRSRWMVKAKAMGIDQAIEWKGWLPKDQVLALYAEYDLLFYPSLRDSGGFVVLEALQCGLPVVCFKLGGPGVVVDDSCGRVIPALPDTEATCEAFSTGVLALLTQVSRDQNISAACRSRSRMFIWDQLVKRIVDNNFKKRA
jgi:Glycosyltransferase